MLSKEEKLECLQKILDSKRFSNSPSSSALLRYLVEQSLNRVQLKEGVIEVELYGESSGQENTNPRVRVNVYNLRKRLDGYYQSEGKQDKCKLLIDKGQYNIRFETISVSTSSSLYEKTKKIFPYVLSIILLFVIVIQNLPQQKPAIWKKYITNELPTTLFVSDAFGTIKTIYTGKPGWVYDYKMHNMDDYYKFIQEHQELKDSLKPATYTYINKESAIASRELKGLFAKYNMDFNIKLTSKTKFADIVAGNLVYVGNPFKENLTSVFNENNPFCKLQKTKLQISGHPTIPDTTLYIHKSTYDNVEYAVVGRMKGPNKSEQFFFFSQHEIGNMATFKLFTDPEYLRSFYNEKLNNKEYFIALFKVYGHERVNSKFEEIMIIPL